MKYTLCLFFIVTILLGTTKAYSQNALSQNSKITSVGAVHNNEDKFYVKVTGGTGPCANSSIFFPVAAFPSQEAQGRAYAAALTALSAEHTVEIYSYIDSTCNNANFILITKP